jgi:hypothetical protein
MSERAVIVAAFSALMIVALVVGCTMYQERIAAQAFAQCLHQENAERCSMR